MRTPHVRPREDKSINNALVYLRACIVRDGLDGLEHVEALLRLRGVDLAAMPVPRKWPNHFRRGELRQAILDALRDGPLTLPQLAERVGKGLDHAAAYRRTYKVLQTMNALGLVRHEGRLWGLATINGRSGHASSQNNAQSDRSRSGNPGVSLSHVPIE